MMKKLLNFRTLFIFLSLIVILLIGEWLYYKVYLFNDNKKQTVGKNGSLINEKNKPQAGEKTESLGVYSYKEDYQLIENQDYSLIIMPPKTNLSSLEYFDYKGERWANGIIREINSQASSISLEIAGKIDQFQVGSDCEFQVSDFKESKLINLSKSPFVVIRVKDYVSVRFDKPKDSVLNKIILYTNDKKRYEDN